MKVSKPNPFCHFCGGEVAFTDLGWGVATNLDTEDILYVYHTECLEEDVDEEA